MAGVKKFFWDMNMVAWTVITVIMLIGIIVLSVWYLSLYGLIH